MAHPVGVRLSAGPRSAAELAVPNGGSATVSAYPIADLTPGDVVLLPVGPANDRTGPLTVTWVREERDGAVSVGWHRNGRPHALRVPLHLAALGVELVVRHVSVD